MKRVVVLLAILAVSLPASLAADGLDDFFGDERLADIQSYAE